jgi:hypothetical protein
LATGRDMWEWLLAANMDITDIILMHARRMDITELTGLRAACSSARDHGTTATGVVDGVVVGATAGAGVTDAPAGAMADADGVMADADTTEVGGLAAAVGIQAAGSAAGLAFAGLAFMDRRAADSMVGAEVAFTVEAADTAVAVTGNRS